VICPAELHNNKVLVVRDILSNLMTIDIEKDFEAVPMSIAFLMVFGS
jgi:hypothetical protein